MDHEVPTVHPETPIHEAVTFLLEHKVTGAPVVDKNDCLVGFLSEYDCLKLLAMGSGSGKAKGTVAEYMSVSVKTVPSHMNIYFVAGMFLNDTIRRFPVVDDGKLVGAITRYDILRAIKLAGEKGEL